MTFYADTKRLSLAYCDVAEVPEKLIQKYAKVVVELDLTENRFKDLSWLMHFENLKHLVLDHNLVNSHTKIPALPKLETLWLNHNKISNLSIFIDALSDTCSQIKYLSMLHNEACPNYFNGGTPKQYQDYRLFVISRLRKLKALDDQPVTDEEVQQSQQLYNINFGAKSRDPSRVTATVKKKKFKLQKITSTPAMELSATNSAAASNNYNSSNFSTSTTSTTSSTQNATAHSKPVRIDQKSVSSNGTSVSSTKEPRGLVVVRSSPNLPIPKQLSVSVESANSRTSYSDESDDDDSNVEGEPRPETVSPFLPSSPKDMTLTAGATMLTFTRRQSEEFQVDDNDEEEGEEEEEEGNAEVEKKKKKKTREKKRRTEGEEAIGEEEGDEEDGEEEEEDEEDEEEDDEEEEARPARVDPLQAELKNKLERLRVSVPPVVTKPDTPTNAAEKKEDSLAVLSFQLKRVETPSKASPSAGESPSTASGSGQQQGFPFVKLRPVGERTPTKPKPTASVASVTATPIPDSPAFVTPMEEQPPTAVVVEPLATTAPSEGQDNQNELNNNNDDQQETTTPQSTESDQPPAPIEESNSIILSISANLPKRGIDSDEEDGSNEDWE